MTIIPVHNHNPTSSIKFEARVRELVLLRVRVRVTALFKVIIKVTVGVQESVLNLQAVWST